MKNFAIIENEKIVNIIVCDDLVIAQALLPEATLVEETESTGTAVIGGSLLDGKFLEPKPYESWTLNSETKKWQAPKPYPTVEETQYATWNETKKDWEVLEFPFAQGE